MTGRIIKDELKSGKIGVSFSRPIVIPPQSYDVIKYLELINFTISGPQQPYEYTWKVESIDSEQIMFGFKLKDPNKIGMLFVSLIKLIFLLGK